MRKLIGGFYGSKDPRGELLLKKRAMLVAEGVEFQAEKTGKAVAAPAPAASGGSRKRKVDDAINEAVIGGDTSRVRVASDSVFMF